MERKRLSYFKHKSYPTLPNNDVTQLMRRANDLDSFLGSKIPKVREIVTAGGTFKTPDFLASKVVTLVPNSTPTKREKLNMAAIQTVCQWTENLIDSLYLKKDQKEVLHAALFENELGRAGLSIVVDVCSSLFATRLGIEPLHFAQATADLFGSKDVDPLLQRPYYVAYYTSGGVRATHSTKEESNSFVACSFAQLSIALISRMKRDLQDRRFESLPGSYQLLAPDYTASLYLSDMLSEGINKQGGLIYELARRISS